MTNLHIRICRAYQFGVQVVHMGHGAPVYFSSSQDKIPPKYSQRWQYFQVVVKAHIIRVQIKQLRVALDAMLNWAKIPDN